MKEGGSSATALLIARSTAWLADDPQLGQFVAPEAVRISWRCLEAASLAGAWLHRRMCAPPFRWLASGAERWVLPGIQLHYALRKRFIEDCVRSALREGARQVVVIGGGFDTLAARLAAELPEAFCLEIDHPATQAVKARALDPRAPNLRLVPADLGPLALDTVLGGTGARWGDGRTVFVIEGVLMYLESERVRETLATCARRGGAGCRVVWTFMQPDEAGRLVFQRSRRALIEAWLRQRSETFTWGLSPVEVPAFLSPLGLRSRVTLGDAALRERYLTPLGLAECDLAAGEGICLAEAV